MSRTYCNPLDLDYSYTPIPNFSRAGRHRATADPCIAELNGVHYLFATNQWGYWWSTDLAAWHFIARSFLRPEHKVYDDLCAPAIWVADGALHVLGSSYTRNFPIWRSRDPRANIWEQAIPALGIPAWDPAVFRDDDGRLYLFHGSNNSAPIFGLELDRTTFAQIGPQVELIGLEPVEHGWQRFGEFNDDTFMRPFLEGPWLTKHEGRYYLQFGTPATEFSGYCDGVAVADRPLGPYTLQEHNPLSLRVGGFARGAGHGGTHRDTGGHHWHVSTVALGVKNSFERRIGMWPAGFTADGLMYCNTAYGDWPVRLPGPGTAGDYPRDGGYAGWQLLSAFAPATASSTLGAQSANFAVDESMKTWWSARTADPGEWLAIDLGAVCEVAALQVNHADQDAEVLGRRPGVRHRYLVEASVDGSSWEIAVDARSAQRDAPHAYHELATIIPARFLRITNVEVPTGRFALMGLRAFGVAPGPVPEPVADFIVLRGAPPGTPQPQPAYLGDPDDINTPSHPAQGAPFPGGEPDRRRAWVRWRSTPDAVGHVVYWGVRPDALFNSAMVHTANEFWCTSLARSRGYWFAIEAYNGAGIGPRSEPVAVP